MANHLLVLEYDGTGYHGFQRQPGLSTIQGALEEALGKVAVLEGPLYAAGRTDAGVHARGQVVSFRAALKVGVERLPLALNSLLPPDIAVLEAAEAPGDFHARRSALAREYAYYIQAGGHPSPFTRRYVHHHRGVLDEGRMREALQALAGVHDFAPFCRREEGKSTVREVYEACLEAAGGLMCIRVKANAFAWMMMRMICGALLEVGRGRWAPARFREVLESGECDHGAPALPPHGLFLEKVYYPGWVFPSAGLGSRMSRSPSASAENGPPGSS
ncbi:MAG: tRNA pseudouridine(38-40) synthase TruA [Actinobacteria bacterium]|nr:tRNA pseudouridine(38-40) synthase TruA [Actinomycetota bacterium]MDI6831090.1 tRNA pseudouridine(38-40) synthase TruA [Actinomycetota bacterium]